ncbi:uncharacterized protein [Drosophila bipectinata]|uniref:uncharacterized protein n=1 Tax=Drosophila bipectinata TaxID=42026 RepID=UPI001C89C2A8|nr:uncharacterized protein LOC108121135 [Drosophila bipectinata]
MGNHLGWKTNATTTELDTTTTSRITIIRPPFPPRCILLPVCLATSPRVCGRLPNGDCQRFGNICQLLLANRRGISAGVVHTKDLECRGIRGVGASNRRPCFYPCPARPVICRRTPPEQEICVRSRNGQSCKVLANRCQLNNQNCHSRPRNNWRRTDRRLCGTRQVGDKPDVCLPIIIFPTSTTRKPVLV